MVQQVLSEVLWEVTRTLQARVRSFQEEIQVGLEAEGPDFDHIDFLNMQVDYHLDLIDRVEAIRLML